MQTTTTNEAPCKYCGGKPIFARAGTLAAFKITAWCEHCSRPATAPKFWYPKSDFTHQEIGAMPWVDVDPVKGCRVCGSSKRIEEHHLAPRAQFSIHFDEWPTVDVCRRCHAQWHERMGTAIDAKASKE